MLVFSGAGEVNFKVYTKTQVRKPRNKTNYVVGTNLADIQNSHKVSIIPTSHIDLTICVCVDTPVGKTLRTGTKYMWKICA